MDEFCNSCWKFELNVQADCSDRLGDFEKIYYSEKFGKLENSIEIENEYKNTYIYSNEFWKTYYGRVNYY